jgi:zinc protease
MTGNLPGALFEKGVESTVSLPGSAAPVRVIVMEDHRMPIVSWSLVLRAGGHTEPVGKEGLASMTADMVRRGPRGKTFDQFNEELESRAISLDVTDGGDTTRIDGSSLKELFPFAINAARQMLLTPAFDAGEFDRLKNQTIDSMRVTLTTPSSVATRQLLKAVYGDSPFGRIATLPSISAITLDDIRAFYSRIYHADNAILMISGDITAADGQRAAQTFLAGFPTGELPKADYALPAPAQSRRIYLIDLQSSRQSAIRLGIPAYSIKSDEKFTGSLAGQMLSYGNESRLGKYVRAEKGYVYGVYCYFRPNRQAGAFVGETDTKFETTGDTLQAIFKVLDDMKASPVPAQELADAKFRVSGQLLMSMETIHDQADRRIDGMLNGYPIDYYDKYPERIAPITAEQVQSLMNKYADESRMAIAVVAPADKVKAQLEKLGSVTVLPAPLPEKQ